MQRHSKWVEATFLPYEYFVLNRYGGLFTMGDNLFQIKRIDTKRKKVWIKFI